MLFRILSIGIIFWTVLLFPGTPPPVRAECGSYFSYAPDPCVNAENYNVIAPYVICSGLQDICCGSQPECQALVTPTPTGVSPTPRPTGTSTHDCGTIWAPGGEEQCLDVVGNQIAPYLRCGNQNTICCRNRSVCPTYRCGSTPGECVYDPNNGFYYHDECVAEQLCGAPPTPTGTPQRFAYQECGGNGIKTALGCIPTQPSEFIAAVLAIGTGLGGGIAFLMILLGGFKILVSRGNPEAMAEGRDIISSAIAGLMLIIFAVFILRFIGVNILALPGFG